MVKICEYCGKEFKSKGKRPKFCCKECSLKARSLKSSKVKVKCIYCGKELERYPSEIRNEVYCSKECLAKYTKENSSVTYKCEICNKTVTTKKVIMKCLNIIIVLMNVLEKVSQNIILVKIQ